MCYALSADVARVFIAQSRVLTAPVDQFIKRCWAHGQPLFGLLPYSVREGSLAAEAEIGSGSELGRGGMGSKVLAAQMASAAGIPTVIAGGSGDEVLGPILAGEARGTRFAADDRGATAFKLWLRFGKPVAGQLHVDEGARRALVEKGASLLGVGVVRCEGRFEPGAAVELVGPDGEVFGKGIAGAGAEEIAGQRGVEAVHRDKLVLYS